MKAGALLLGLALAAGALEVASRAVTNAYWNGRVSKDDPGHYYQAASNPVLAYELAPGIRRRGDLYLVVNRYGIRDESDDLATDSRRVALLGDSFGFGIAQGQEQTIAAHARNLLAGEPARVLNLGVPGYEIAEVAENFQVKDDIYDFDDALYLLNLNDFARRGSVYEGADNGLYRMYRPADWSTPYLLRKAYYRWKKHGHLGSSSELSEEWYRWLFTGNRDFARRQLNRMAAYARKRGIRFGAVILPVGSAFSADGDYRLADLSGQIRDMLRELGIPSIDPAPRFAANPAELIDETEHPTEAGNVALAELVVQWIREGAERGEGTP
jgi:hypothetical protein